MAALSLVRGTFDLRMPPMVDFLNWLAEAIGVTSGLDPCRPEPMLEQSARRKIGWPCCRPLVGNADAEIDQRELQRGGPSYFVDTLRSFRSRRRALRSDS